MVQEFVLSLYGVKAPALQGRRLGMANGVLDRTFAVGVSHAGRIGHHAVMSQGGRIHHIELGLVQVGLDNPFLEIV